MITIEVSSNGDAGKTQSHCQLAIALAFKLGVDAVTDDIIMPAPTPQMMVILNRALSSESGSTSCSLSMSDDLIGLGFARKCDDITSHGSSNWITVTDLGRAMTRAST